MPAAAPPKREEASGQQQGSSKSASLAAVAALAALAAGAFLFYKRATRRGPGKKARDPAEKAPAKLPTKEELREFYAKKYQSK